ncbi:MAG: 2'-5' RNA ligase [Lachnospiraceae bacterium]|jgi:hypothetical protein|nr:2'-5' RNA ligase [Lachnospiraceae bacterium]
MRNLASIQKIIDISPIEGADAIEVVSVLGWKVVTKKNEFHVGDLCVYFEIDSFLPIDERFEFLRSTSYRKNDFVGRDGFRLRTIKLRGQVSQGLVLPLSYFPELKGKAIGDDVTEILKVDKWELPEVQGSMGTTIGSFPDWASKTDEVRLQTILPVLEELKGKLLELKRNITVQGEFCGVSIQSNKLRLLEDTWYVFTVVDVETGDRASLDELIKTCEYLGVPTVPIEEVGDSFNYQTLEELLARADGSYPKGGPKEGIVIRSRENMFSKVLGAYMSFKVINNRFLLKEKE